MFRGWLDTARQWITGTREGGKGVSLQTVIESLLASKRAGNRRPVYVKSLAYYLGKFASSHPNRMMDSFTVEDFDGWLARHSNPNSRQTWINRLSTLWAFAVRRGWCPDNPLDRLDRVRVDRRSPRVLSPGEASSLWAATPTLIRPYVCLGLYAGLRPDEVMRLQWGDIDLVTSSYGGLSPQCLFADAIGLEPAFEVCAASGANAPESLLSVVNQGDAELCSVHLDPADFLRW
jgi:integrase